MQSLPGATAAGCCGATWQLPGAAALIRGLYTARGLSTCSRAACPSALRAVACRLERQLAHRGREQVCRHPQKEACPSVSRPAPFAFKAGQQEQVCKTQTAGSPAFPSAFDVAASAIPVMPALEREVCSSSSHQQHHNPCAEGKHPKRSPGAENCTAGCQQGPITAEPQTNSTQQNTCKKTYAHHAAQAEISHRLV